MSDTPEIISSYQTLFKQIGFSHIEKIQCFAIRKEASMRSYYRIIPAETYGHLHHSFILCTNLPIPYKDDDMFLSLSRFFHDSGVKVPQVLAVNEKKGAMLLSDGGEYDLEQVYKQYKIKHANEHGLMLTHLYGAIELLFQIQSLQLDTLPQQVQKRYFDYEKLKSEMAKTNEQLENIANKKKISIEFRPEFLHSLETICLNLASSPTSPTFEKQMHTLPVVLCHRDYHSRNLLLVSNEMNNKINASRKEDYTLIDYQDARLGLPCYDLSSLLYDPYLDLPLDFIELGLKFYKEHSPLKFSSEEDFANLFYQQSLQRVYKALGTYLYQSYVCENEAYEKYIAIALKTCKHLCEKEELLTNLTDVDLTILQNFFAELQEKFL